MATTNQAYQTSIEVKPINAIIVFQGGGIKGIALAGAMQALEEQKINPIKVAGTSAGSIVACLVAAEYTSSEILSDVIQKIPADFDKILTAFPHSSDTNSLDKLKEKYLGNIKWPKSYFVKKVVKGVEEKYPEIQTFAQHLGLYDGVGLETYINGLLVKKLSTTDDPKILICFKHLPIPLYVITTDILNSKIKVFSKESTPEASVAKAVRASCSIPGIFAPVVESDGVYVDGGIISNLPISIVEHTVDKRRLSSTPIIGFNLQTNREKQDNKPFDIEEYGENLINAITNGNVDLQKNSLGNNSHIVSILLPMEVPTFDKTYAKDVAKLTAVYNEGKKHAIKRLKEIDLFSKPIPKHPEFLENAEEYFDLIQRKLTQARNNFYFILDELDDRLLYNLVLTLTIKRVQGLIITVVYIQRDSHEGERGILALVKLLGIELIHINGCEERPEYFKGFIMDYERDYSEALVIESHEYALLYKRGYDRFVIKHLNSILSKLLKSYTTQKIDYIPEIQKVNIDDFLKSYKIIPFYSDEAVTVTLEKFDPCMNDQKLKPHTKFVKAHKLNQIELLRQYVSKNIDDYEPYIPLKIKLAKDIFSNINPPIVEEHNGVYHIIEGHNRFYYSRQLKEKEINVIVVRGVKEALPSKWYYWSEMKVLTTPADEDETNRDNNKQLLRRVEFYTHNVKEWISTSKS